MNRNVMFAAAVIVLSLAIPAQADDVTAGVLKISAPWARATPKGATIGGGYLKIANTGNAPDRLIGGSCDLAGRFEIHEMSMDKGVMKMRAVTKGLEINPGQTVEFKPGGYHVMFVGLKKPFTKGEQVKATLQFEKAGKVNVVFMVEGIGAQGPESAGGGEHAMPGMQMKH